MFNCRIDRFLNDNVHGYWFDIGVRFVPGDKVQNFIKMMENGDNEVNFKTNAQPVTRLLQSTSNNGNSEGSFYSHILLQLSYRPS